MVCFVGVVHNDGIVHNGAFASCNGHILEVTTFQDLMIVGDLNHLALSRESAADGNLLSLGHGRGIFGAANKNLLVHNVTVFIGDGHELELAVFGLVNRDVDVGGDLLQFASARLFGADSDSFHVGLDLDRGWDGAIRSVVADDDIFVDGVAVVVSDRDHCEVAMLRHRFVDVDVDGDLLLLAHLSVSIADGHNLGSRGTLVVHHWLVHVVDHRWHGSGFVMVNGLDIGGWDRLWSVVADDDFFVLSVAVSISHWDDCDVAMLGHRLVDVDVDGDLLFFANLSVSIADGHNLGSRGTLVVHHWLVHVVDHRWHGSHRGRRRRSMHSWHRLDLVLKKIVILGQGPDELLVLGGGSAKRANFSMAVRVTRKSG